MTGGVFLPFRERTPLDDKLDALTADVREMVYAWKERHAGHELIQRWPLIGGGVLVDIRCATCPDDVPPCLLTYTDRDAIAPSPSTEFHNPTEETDRRD